MAKCGVHITTGDCHYVQVLERISKKKCDECVARTKRIVDVRRQLVSKQLKDEKKKTKSKEEINVRQLKESQTCKQGNQRNQRNINVNVLIVCTFVSVVMRRMRFSVAHIHVSDRHVLVCRRNCAIAPTKLLIKQFAERIGGVCAQLICHLSETLFLTHTPIATSLVRHL